MRRASLRLRIARLERQSLVRRWPKVCSAIYDCEADIIGIGDGASNHLERQPGETLQELVVRAFAKFGDVRNLAAIYAPRLAPEPPQRDLPMMAVQAHAKPDDLDGIGEIDNGDFLEKRGFIPIRAERHVD